jgi:hypothetical protein
MTSQTHELCTLRVSRTIFYILKQNRQATLATKPHVLRNAHYLKIIVEDPISSWDVWELEAGRGLL